MDAPHFKSAHYTDHLRSLQTACEWMGIDLGRAAQYRNLVREFFAEDKRSREHILAYNESCEIIDIYELWEAYIHHFPGLTQKVKAVLSSGPSLREDERPETSNNRPRNDAFVYLVAGKLIRAGVKIITVDGIVAQGVSCPSDADITFDWYGSPIAIECKRPQTQKKVARGVRDARHQLTKPNRQAERGIIALDCSGFVRPQERLLEADSAEDAERFLADALAKAVRPKVERNLETSILGYLLFARAPAMTRMGHSSIVSPQGAPLASYFRPDSISTWLMINNADSASPEVLRSVAQLLSQAIHTREGPNTGLAQGYPTDHRSSHASQGTLP